MRQNPTAFGVISADSEAHAWERAQVQRLARHLGYLMIWPPEDSLIPLPAQVREADVDIVIASSTEYLDALTLNAIMAVCGVEVVTPRLSFSRWTTGFGSEIGMPS